MGEDPDPVAKPPPCSQTITGRLRPAPSPGVKTFRTRQSSSSLPRPWPEVDPCAGRAPGLVCGALGPYANASRTPVHGAGLVGSMNRFFPLVGPPYGIPLKILMSSTEVPRTRPYAVSATAPAAPALLCV